jgi:hypothetical protein
VRKSKRASVPWYRSLGHTQYWAVLVATFGYGWASEATLVYTIAYLHEVHKYSVHKTSLLMTIP